MNCAPGLLGIICHFGRVTSRPTNPSCSRSITHTAAIGRGIFLIRALILPVADLEEIAHGNDDRSFKLKQKPKAKVDAAKVAPIGVIRSLR
jgi:hypothetical protein